MFFVIGFLVDPPQEFDFGRKRRGGGGKIV